MSQSSGQEEMDRAINSVHYLLSTGYDQTIVEQMKIINSRDTPIDLYHISWDNSIKRFVPRCSTYVLPDESVVLPHVSTAPSLIGCLIGTSFRLSKQEDITLATIYRLAWKVAVIPPVKLLPDVNRTSEHWLLPIDPNNRNHLGSIVGQYFVLKETTLMTKARDIYSTVIYLRVMSNEMMIYPGCTVGRGYYRIEVSDIDQLIINGVKDSEQFVSYTEVAPQVYQRQYMLRNLDEKKG